MFSLLPHMLHFPCAHSLRYKVTTYSKEWPTANRSSDVFPHSSWLELVTGALLHAHYRACDLWSYVTTTVRLTFRGRSSWMLPWDQVTPLFADVLLTKSREMTNPVELQACETISYLIDPFEFLWEILKGELNGIQQFILGHGGTTEVVIQGC